LFDLAQTRQRHDEELSLWTGDLGGFPFECMPLLMDCPGQNVRLSKPIFHVVPVARPGVSSDLPRCVEDACQFA
jgi:hypothetical protein